MSCLNNLLSSMNKEDCFLYDDYRRVDMCEDNQTIIDHINKYGYIHIAVADYAYITRQSRPIIRMLGG